jgi:hypothetical protein
MKRLFHIPAHEDFKALPLALLTQGHQLFVTEFLSVGHKCFDVPRTFLPVTNL